MSLSHKRLIIKVSVDEASASSGRLSLAAWLPGSPEFVDLGSETSRVGAMLTFKISARRFLHDEFASSNGSANGTTDHWVLLLQAKERER